MVLDQLLLQVCQNVRIVFIELLTVAIVTAAFPESAAFMADESYNAVYPCSKINYTLPSYLDYLQQLKMKATELNTASKKILYHNVIQQHISQRSLECS